MNATETDEYQTLLRTFCAETDCRAAFIAIGVDDRGLQSIWTVPEAYRMPILRYALFGIEPGVFLRYVLENNLIGALRARDMHDLRELSALVKFVADDLPVNSRGTHHAVKGWIAEGGIVGLQMRARA